MPRTDDQLMRDMVEVSGDRASMYRRRLPPENSPTYAALHWWMSLEDIEDEGNRATLDGFTVSWPWSDYTAAVVTIGHRAICMTAVPHERHPEIAYVQFVHSCIEPGCTTGEVRIDDIY